MTFRVDDRVTFDNKAGEPVTATVLFVPADGGQLFVKADGSDIEGWVDTAKVALLPVEGQPRAAESTLPATTDPSLLPIEEQPVSWATLSMLIQTPTVPNRYRESPTGIQDMYAAVLYGREMGIQPMESIQSFYLVNGTASMTGKLMSSLIHRAGHQLRMRYKPDHVELTCLRRDPYTRELVEVGVVTFGKKDEVLAELSEKDAYIKFPRIMWGWRAVAMAARLYYADVLSGIGHLPQELGVDTDVEAIPMDDIDIDFEDGGEAELDLHVGTVVVAVDGEVVDHG